MPQRKNKKRKLHLAKNYDDIKVGDGLVGHGDYTPTKEEMKSLNSM